MTEIRPIALDNGVGTIEYYARHVADAVAAGDRAAYKRAMLNIARCALSFTEWADDLNNPMTAPAAEVSNG